MQPVLFIIRGLPNTGKTETARLIAPLANAAANDYLPKGKEAFEAKDFEKAHQKCRSIIEGFMVSKQPIVAVHNTFTRLSEMTQYITMAKKYGYAVNIIECKTHFPGNLHNVPKDIVKKYGERWEPMSGALLGGYNFK